MMKGLFMLLIFFFLIKFYNKFLIQLISQFMIVLFLMLIYISFPLNNVTSWCMIYYFFSLDSYSYGMFLLSSWIMSLMMMTGKNFLDKVNFKFYIKLMILMMIVLAMCFSTFNLFLFYIMFEISLLPIFMLILGWGYQVERIQAGFYMMLYTLFGSMPLFMMIMYLYYLNYSFMMNLIMINNTSFLIYCMMIMAFLVKLPMYMVHLWLPKAHVEAPVMGSMILAGVMLKLGSYGLLRVMFMMLETCMKFNKFFVIISLMGSLYASLICLCQVDMKMLVAYSSVVHMGMTLAGMMTLFNWGIMGGFLMMLAHGMCSSAMFCLVNINYERFMSRSMFINKGMINYFPSMSFIWFLICSSNMSFPPSLNLFSEILLVNSLVIWSKLIILILILLLFFSAAYTLYLYSYTQHGKFYSMSFFFTSVNISEYMLVLLHWFPVNILLILMYFYL